MTTLFKNEFCEIVRTIEGKLIRRDLILDTEMYITSYFDRSGKLIRL